MTKHKSAGTKTRSPSGSASGRADTRPGQTPPGGAIARHRPSAAGIRETIESVAIAFVLAFLFRTFEAEAFVIPTGSMAPTLMGRHKDLVCPKCGCPYQLGASEEVDQDGAVLEQRHPIDHGTCPMCRYTADLGPDNPQHKSYPSYNGDRILVCKFAYDLSELERWDIIVFKFPGDLANIAADKRTDARTNFIKRLVGLPGETLRIQNGDVWTRRGDEPFRIARKPPEKLLAMLQPVFDNDYMPRIAEYGWPPRWTPTASADGSAAGAWSSDDYATFRTDGTAAGEHWLRYRHLTPSYWQGDTREQVPGGLIRDFTAYDTSRYPGDFFPSYPAPAPDSFGSYWVGDLALRCTVEAENNAGELIFELRKGGRDFRCNLDLATGRATLSISGQDMQQFRPTAATSVRGPGRHEITFSNCDNELRLWVDGRVVQFDGATAYEDLDNHRPQKTDYSPVGVATVGAKARLSHLAIFRDIYYIADSPTMSGPSEEGVRNQAERFLDFSLLADQFFVLGDNSPRSRDSRLWGSNNYWVPRDLLIGKALFIYWPHSWDKIPLGPNVNVPFPFFPNVGRMGLVR